MKPVQDRPPPHPGAGVACAVLAQGQVEAKLEQFPPLRLKPGPLLGEPLPPNFLKHTDEQTVAGLAAVLQAIATHGLSATPFTDWGVVAAPCYLGRSALTAALLRFASEGAWGISPHLIPHRSQHAVSGTVSQVLKLHGPNFGVGGGPGAVVEALHAAAALVAEGRVPGVWVVITGWDPEALPDADGALDPTAVCRAVALALAPCPADWHGPRLTLVAGDWRDPGTQLIQTAPQPTIASVATLFKSLAAGEAHPTSVVWHLEGGARAELSSGRALVRPMAVPAKGAGQPCLVTPAGAGTESKR